MATFNTTGGKYAIQTLSAVGTTNVTIATATFVSGDFGTTQRIVALYDSSNVFKGIAWVRRFVSTTVLELENQFVDPVTGLFATQTTTDKILVSKVPSEVVVAGITYDAVTRSSSLTSGWEIGTFSSQTSACIYAENTKFAMTDGIMINGGVVVFGKLLSYDGVSKESFVWNRECSLEPLSTFAGAGAGSFNYSVLRPNTAGANFFMFGGNVGGSYQSSNFMGIVGGGTGGRSFAFFGTRQNYGCTSPSNGTTWGVNAARHLLYKCSFEATYTNANLIMWGDGTWEGGSISFPQYVSGPLGAFRANGTSAYAAPSGVRALVSDLGQGALIDGISSSTYNFTNLITPAVNSLRTGSSGASTINANFYYQDDYTNLKANTTIVVRRTVDSVVATSVVNTALTSFTARVLQSAYTATTVGNMTQTSNYTSFDYAIKCYGYNAVSGNHSVVNYSLGTGGTGKNLTLGGLQNQSVDNYVTLTLANALALSSKIALNDTTYNATISGASTYDELYDYGIAWNCSSVARAQLPNLSTYIYSASGTTLTPVAEIYSTAALSQGTKLKDLTGNKKFEINGASASASFNRGTITWNPSTYLAQWFVQAGATLSFTNNTLFTVNAQAALGYDTKTMFGVNSTLNLTDSTMVFNAPTGATSYGGSVFSAFQANGTATMNISNGVWTFNGPTAGSTYVVHTYWSAASNIDNFTINGTAASAVALEMGATNQKLSNLNFAGQFNGSANGTNKQFYVHIDSLNYTGTTSPLNTSTARLVKWVWLDPKRSDNALFRWAVGTQGATGANGQFGVVYFRPNIIIDKAGYAPKMRLKASNLSSRYATKTFNTTELSTVDLSNFYTDSGFAVGDGALPFVDSLDSKIVINTIDWTIDVRQAGWADQTVTFTAATAKKGTLTTTFSGAIDANYVNATTGLADSALITVNTTTKTIAPVSGNLSWSPQRLYNALKNWWATYASDTDFLIATGGGYLDLGDYNTSSTLKFEGGELTDALYGVRTTGLINAPINDISVTDANGTSTIWEFGNDTEPVVDGTSIALYDTSGNTVYYQAVTTDGVYKKYISSGTTGTYHYAIERYGYKREEGTFPANAGGRLFYVPNYSEDIGVTDTKTNVAAYTTLSTTSQIYDATAYFRLSETGIKLGQLVARDGLYLDFGTYNVKIKDDATAIVAVASGIITYKSIVVNETTKYTAMKATPPATITPTDTEIINVLIEDANGDSKLSILGGDNLGYELWKVTTATATDDYATGTLLTTLPDNTQAFRFIGISGYDIVGRDISSGVRRRSSMLKGSYEQAFYVGNQIQLATDAPQLQENNDKLSEVILKLDTKLDVAISTRLADADYIDPATPQQVWEYTTRTLTSGSAGGATLAEIEASTVLAKEATSQSIKTTVEALENTDLTGIATTTDVTNAQTAIEDKIDAIPATDLTGITDDLTIINEGVKKASLFIPHTTNLT